MRTFLNIKDRTFLGAAFWINLIVCIGSTLLALLTALRRFEYGKRGKNSTYKHLDSETEEMLRTIDTLVQNGNDAIFHACLFLCGFALINAVVFYLLCRNRVTKR